MSGVKINFVGSKKVLNFAARKTKEHTPMKTTTPQVTINIDKTKTRKDGTAPIYINVSWKGRAKMATGYYTRPEDFSSKSLVKNQPKINKALRDILQRIDERIIGLDLGKATAKDVLYIKQDNTIKFTNVLVMMTSERKLAEKTIEGYTSAIKRLRKTTGKPMSEITTDELQGWAREWKSELKLSTIWNILSRLQSLYTYAKEKKLLTTSPFDEWNFKRDGYKIQDNHRALNDMEKALLWDWTKKTGDDAGILWWAGYFFNGLALVDLLRIDWADLEIVTINNHLCVSTNINRSKTNIHVPVICVLDDDTRKGVVLAAMKAINLNKRDLKGWTRYINKHLKMSPIEGLTYYSCRHTYATDLVNSNASLNDIASLLGRSLQNIQCYIQQITKVDHLVEVLTKKKAPKK